VWCARHFSDKNARRAESRFLKDDVSEGAANIDADADQRSWLRMQPASAVDTDIDIIPPGVMLLDLQQ
jgi:hypothetical protein